MSPDTKEETKRYEERRIESSQDVRRVQEVI